MSFERAALIMVDLQNDFAHPDGSLYVAGGEAVVEDCNRYAAAFNHEGVMIFASRDWHPGVTNHFIAYGGEWPVHCVQQSWGASFAGNLVLPQAIILDKGVEQDQPGYSAFEAKLMHGLPLADFLHGQGLTTLYVCGLTTNFCVKETVLRGIEQGFRMILLTDACAAVNRTPGDGEAAIAAMVAAGAITATYAAVWPEELPPAVQGDTLIDEEAAPEFEELPAPVRCSDAGDPPSVAADKPPVAKVEQPQTVKKPAAKGLPPRR